MAKGYQVPEAVKNAKELITRGIRDSFPIGKGIDVMDFVSIVHSNGDQDQIIHQITLAADELTQILKPYFVPEVGINIGYAKSSAKTKRDICALTGRLVRVGEGVRYLGNAEYGASKHIARIILTVMKKDRKIRCAMNIKYRPEIIKVCGKLRFSIGTFSRSVEPEEASTMEWGTKAAIEELGFVPDLIFDTGGIGKEPMIRILGKDPQDVLKKVKKIVKNII